MSSGEPAPSESSSRFSRSRSFPNVLSGLLFNPHSWATHQDSTRQQNPAMAAISRPEVEEPKADSSSVTLLSGSPFNVDDFQFAESTADVMMMMMHTAPKAPMQRSGTWATELHTASTPSQQTPSQFNPIKTSGGTGNNRFSALQRSLSEIFGADKLIVDAKDKGSCARAENANSNNREPLGQPSQQPRLSLPDLDLQRSSASTVVAPEQVQSPKRGSLFHSSSLDVVLEDESSNQNRGDTPAARFWVMRDTDSVVRRQSSLDENHNHIEQVSPESSLVKKTPADLTASSSASISNESKMATTSEAMTSSDHVTKAPIGSIRRVGILDLLVSGEKKSFRNRDVNMMAPQSW